MFSIGAFSRLTQLSIRMLRHYDDIGLLKPAHTNRANGYRYYSSQQLGEVHRIVALKELGLSLDQVQMVMKEQHSVEAIRGMLRLEKLRAEEERIEAERRLRNLDQRLAELTELGKLSDIDAVEKSVATTPFLAYRERVTNLDAAYALMNEVMARCAALGPWTPLIAVGHDDFFDTENIDIELGYAVDHRDTVDLGGGRLMTPRELPAVDRVLSIIHVGNEAEGHRRTHNAIAIWLERHRCALAGPVRELVYSANDATPTVEIQYPIRDAEQ